MKSIIYAVALLGALAARAAYIPLTFTNPALPATGSFLVSVWVKPASAAMNTAMVNLTLREVGNSQTEDRDLIYARLTNGHWTRLSAWVAATTGVTRSQVLVWADYTGQVQLAWADLRAPSSTLPPFPQGFVRVHGRVLTNNDGTVLLRGVNITAYTDSSSDDPGQVLAMICPRDYEQIAARGFNAV